MKILLQQGQSLVGRLVLYDALGMKFREFPLQKDPECPLCGTQPTIRELVDYEAFCSARH